jgi:histone H3/H4
MAETYVYASRIKELAKKHGLRMSGDAAEALNAQIVEMVKAAAERAKGNKRKTIYTFDF